MLADHLGHVEHRDLTLAAEDRAELVIGIDGAAVLGVLQTVPLDVLPELLGHLGPGNRRRAYHGGELRTWLHRLHERGARHPLLAGGLLGGLLGGALGSLLGGGSLGGFLRWSTCGSLILLFGR